MCVLLLDLVNQWIHIVISWAYESLKAYVVCVIAFVTFLVTAVVIIVVLLVVVVVR